MFLFIGLGNKGKEYQDNRHNLGFFFIDYLVKRYNFNQINNKLKSTLYKGKILNHNIILSKPSTMMNLSGESVRLIKNFYNIDHSNIYVFHDELDLSIAKVKFKFGGSSAGHNGIKNIDKNIGNTYYRIRVGIKNINNKATSDKFVLSNFSNEERVKIYNKIELINKNIKYIFNKEINNFMNVIN